MHPTNTFTNRFTGKVSLLILTLWLIAPVIALGGSARVMTGAVVDENGAPVAEARLAVQSDHGGVLQ